MTNKMKTRCKCGRKAVMITYSGTNIKTKYGHKIKIEPMCGRCLVKKHDRLQLLDTTITEVLESPGRCIQLDFKCLIKPVRPKIKIRS
jgi:hypothetical protein